MGLVAPLWYLSREPKLTYSANRSTFFFIHGYNSLVINKILLGFISVLGSFIFEVIRLLSGIVLKDNDLRLYKYE
jgi:hypothetical protein